MFKNKKYLYILYSLIFIFIFCAWGYSCKIFNDYTWHIKAGEWMAQNKQILTHNIFSYAIPENTVWYSHEWLSELLMYFSLKIFKVDFAYFCITITATLATLLAVLRKDIINKDIKSTIFITIMILMSFSTSLYARPFILGLLFFALLMKAVDDIRNNRNSKLYLFLPLITILWVNIHGGTAIFSVIAPIGYLICGKFRFMTNRFYSVKSSKEQEKKYLYLIIGNFIATLLNPFTYKIYLFSFIINDSTAKSGIIEWSPASISWPISILVIICVCLFLIMTSKKINFTDFAVVGGLILLTLIYARFYSWLDIAFMVIFFKYLPNKKDNPKDAEIFKQFDFEIKLFFIVSIVFLGFTIYSNPFPKVEQMMNYEVIEAIDELKPNRLFNDYNSGGMINYYDKKCFANSIAELYDRNILKCSKNLLSLALDFYEFMDYYEFDAYLVDKTSVLYLYLSNNPDEYELVYEDTTEDEETYMTTYALFSVIEN